MIITVGQLIVVLLIIARIAGVFSQAPVFSSRSFPALGKTAIAVWLGIVLWFVTPVNTVLPTTLAGLMFALALEVAVGFVIGFACNIIFIAVQSAGEVADMQMGLSVATALDPVFGSVISIIGRLMFFLALILFLAADGHHLILSALHQSFVALPAGKAANFGSPALATQLIKLGGSLWLTAFTLAAPIVLLIFLSDFTFGIVFRVAPQVNVFMLGFQVKPALGLFGLMVTLPFVAKHVVRLIEFMVLSLAQITTAMGG